MDIAARVKNENLWELRILLRDSVLEVRCFFSSFTRCSALTLNQRHLTFLDVKFLTCLFCFLKITKILINIFLYFN